LESPESAAAGVSAMMSAPAMTDEETWIAATPLPRDSTPGWRPYTAAATVGYVIYGLGTIGPYLRAQLGLSSAEVGLHSTAMATGLVVAGLAAGTVATRFGWRTTRAAALLLLAVAIVALAAAPELAVTLAASLVLGTGAGIVLGYANAELAEPGGSRSRLRLARANVWAIVAAFTAPLIVAVCVSAGVGWWVGLAPSLALLAVLAVDLDGARAVSEAGDGSAIGRLPTAFWLAWWFVVSVVALEFSIVVWGSTLIEQRTGVTTPVATLIGSLFLAGMFAGRLALSVGLGTGGDARRPIRIGLLAAGLGAVIAWVSTLAALSAVALFIAGCGVAILYPTGTAIALGASGGRLATAGARLTLASGVAILVAPFALGIVADLTGVVTGWALVPGLAAIALALVSTLPRGAGET
jgi:fucose permease